MINVVVKRSYAWLVHLSIQLLCQTASVHHHIQLSCCCVQVILIFLGVLSNDSKLTVWQVTALARGHPPCHRSAASKKDSRPHPQLGTRAMRALHRHQEREDGHTAVAVSAWTSHDTASRVTATAAAPRVQHSAPPSRYPQAATVARVRPHAKTPVPRKCAAAGHS